MVGGHRCAWENTVCSYIKKKQTMKKKTFNFANSRHLFFWRLLLNFLHASFFYHFPFHPIAKKSQLHTSSLKWIYNEYVLLFIFYFFGKPLPINANDIRRSCWMVRTSSQNAPFKWLGWICDMFFFFLSQNETRNFRTILFVMGMACNQ